MTDEELIKHLRLSSYKSPTLAADRIEQLVKERDEAEAKLAKVVVALRYVVSAKGLTDPTEYGYDAIKRARAVLDELEEKE